MYASRQSFAVNMSQGGSPSDDELAKALQKMHIHSEESMEEGSDEKLVIF